MFSGFPHYCSDRLWPWLGLLAIPLQERRRISSVGTVTSYQLHNRAVGVPFPTGQKVAKDFCVLKLAHKTGTGWLFPANSPACEADHSQITSTEVVILWLCTSISQYAFIISRIKPTDNFAFVLPFSYEMLILCVYSPLSSWPRETYCCAVIKDMIVQWGRPKVTIESDVCWLIGRRVCCAVPLLSW